MHIHLPMLRQTQKTLTQRAEGCESQTTTCASMDTHMDADGVTFTNKDIMPEPNTCDMMKYVGRESTWL